METKIISCRKRKMRSVAHVNWKVEKDRTSIIGKVVSELRSCGVAGRNWSQTLKTWTPVFGLPRRREGVYASPLGVDFPSVKWR